MESLGENPMEEGSLNVLNLQHERNSWNCSRPPWKVLMTHIHSKFLEDRLNSVIENLCNRSDKLTGEGRVLTTPNHLILEGALIFFWMCFDRRDIRKNLTSFSHEVNLVHLTFLPGGFYPRFQLEIIKCSFISVILLISIYGC